MFLDGIYLKEFIRSVPLCLGYESLGALIDLFNRSRSDRVVWVDAHHHPLGVVRLSSVLPYLPKLLLKSADSAAIDPWGNVAKLHTVTLLEGLAATMTPLIVLPEGWSVKQFLTSMPLVEQEYALVNAEAQFVGLLDSDRLLTALVHAGTAPRPDPDLPTDPPVTLPLPAMPELPDPDMLQVQQQQILGLTQQLLAQRAALEQRIKLQQNEIHTLKHNQAPVTGERSQSHSFDALRLPSTALPPTSPMMLGNALLELLERLPLPLMLQTNAGEVLAQNSVWRQQVGELSAPVQIWREAAACLATQAVDTGDPWGVTATIPSDRPVPASAISPESETALVGDRGFCQIGTHPDSCICVCPLRDGHEQVLQFVKISLGTLLPNLDLNWATASESWAVSSTPPSWRQTPDRPEPERAFQLATLTPITTDSQPPAPRPWGQAFQLDSPDRNEAPPRSLWLVMAQDVTQQQNLARELTAKNADLVQLNRLKDEFLACISHELKTPLTAVLGLSSLLKDQTLGELNPRQVHYAQLIYQSSRHLMGVVNDILDLTRIETGQLELLYGTVDIPMLCQRAFEQARQIRLLDAKTMAAAEPDAADPTLELEIDPTVGLLVADEMRLRQMVVHLLSNALKFSPQEQIIGLKVGRWGGWIAFTVWDTGIGIPSEKQHLIFQKFQQLENPLTRQFEGAGLGLVLTRRLARLHGGDVTFISKEGVGSQFTILLPPTPPNQAHRAEAEGDGEEDLTGAGPNLRYPGGRVPIYSSKVSLVPEPPIFLAQHVRDRLILIVEAVPQFVESLTEQLTGLGYRVIVARSGTEALEKARRLQPSVIFLNPLLPLLSGWDVLTLLKSGQETKHIPVVVTATAANEPHLHQHQASSFLSLPMQPQKLQAILQQLLTDTRQPKETPKPTALTILHLFCANEEESVDPWLDLEQLLKSQPYRILESDDLEQADLLASVWQPNVVVVEGAIANPDLYLKQLSRRSVLAALPIITFDARFAEAANQIKGLKVFPCLLDAGDPNHPATPDLTTLLQVIQLAAGHRWRSSVLAVDVAMLTPTDGAGIPDGSEEGDRPSGSATDVVRRFPQETEWLQALMQYLQTAGLNAFIGHSWPEVMQQMASQSIDLLLLCWTHGEPQPDVINWLGQLADNLADLPILVLDHRDPELGETNQIPLPEPVRRLATEILSPPIAMAELLAKIQQTLR